MEASAAPAPAHARPPRRPQVLKGCLALAGAAFLGGLAAYAVATSRHPSDAAGVGDGATSDAEASLFFDSLDSDADGQIERDELESYVGGAIGGHVLDSAAEIADGVASIFENADADADAQLSATDMRAYWKALGSLLSVREVAAWVEHAVQLPRDIADKFVDAGVSGYDFAELARDASERGALKTEVGVRTQRQRATLARAMRMRLTGVGDPPASPAPLSILGGAKCTSAHLAWTAADGGGFPTHKYVLERRAKREGTAWEVVSDGYVHEFRDERLRPGVGYDYRVAAWNAIGRGPYATASASSAQREACDPLEYVGAMALAPLFSLLRSAVFLGQLLLSGIVLFLAALRLVDAGAGDADYHPVFRALWTLCRVVTDYVPFARDLLLLVDPALGRVEVPELRERRTPGESDHALVGTSPATLPPEMSAPARRASSLNRRSRSPPLTRSSSAGSLGDDRERPSDAACSQCGKPFITGYRTRHYCYVCAASFCKRCGVVKHSNMVTCPVGAKCACARCAHDQPALGRLPSRSPEPPARELAGGAPVR